MYRSRRLVVRLSDTEQEAIAKLAQVEKLPAATMARRLLLREAEKQGVGSEARSQQVKEVIQRG